MGGLVAFALQGVFGALIGETFLMQNPANLIVAQANTGGLDHGLGQAPCRPCRETVSEVQGRGLNHLAQRFAKRRHGPAGSTRWFDRVQRVDAAHAVLPANPSDRLGTAPQPAEPFALAPLAKWVSRPMASYGYALFTSGIKTGVGLVIEIYLLVEASVWSLSGSRPRPLCKPRRAPTDRCDTLLVPSTREPSIVIGPVYIDNDSAAVVRVLVNRQK